MTEDALPVRDVQAQPIQTYREKVMRRVFFTTLALILTCWPPALIFAHPVASLFWDWWYFSYKKVKESSIFPQEYLTKHQLTADDVDHYMGFVVTSRRIAALYTIVLCLASMYMFKDWGKAVAIGFYSTYYFVRWVITYAAIKFGHIKFPYQVGFNGNPEDDRMKKLFDEISSMTDPRNPIGYNNPASPAYVGRDHYSSPFS